MVIREREFEFMKQLWLGHFSVTLGDLRQSEPPLLGVISAKDKTTSWLVLPHVSNLYNFDLSRLRVYEVNENMKIKAINKFNKRGR